MKIKILLMAFLALIAYPKLYGQCQSPPNCILNSGFDQGTNTGVGNLMGSSMPNWSVLSGTPSYANGMTAATVITWGIQLDNSEGIFACYNFRVGRTYRVCFRAYNPNTVSAGSILIEAHNGGTGVQTIANPSFYNSSLSNPRNMALQEFTFIAGNNFNQLRFSIPALSNPSYSVVIDDVGVIEVPDVTVTPATIDGCGAATINVNSANTLGLSWIPNTNITAINSTTFSASPCQTTTYTLSYTAVCQQWTCNNGTEQITITVNPGTSVTASPATITNCDASTLTASSVNPMSVTWSPTIGLTPSTGNVVLARPCSTTTYKASFYCAQNNCTYTEDVNVFVQQNGSIVNRTANPCGSTIDLEYLASTPCPGATYRWYHTNNPGVILSTTSQYNKPVSSKADQGTYYVIVKSPNGCLDTFYTAVVMDCCKLLVDFEVIDCNPIRFKNTTTEGPGGNEVILGEWYWDFGDGTTSNIRNPSKLYTNFWDSTEVCLTAVVEQDQSTCCAKICKKVKFCDFACDPKAAFAYALVTPGTTLVQFTDNSVGSGTPINYEWTVNGVLDPTATGWSNPVINLGAPLPPGPAKRYSICMKVWYYSGFGSPCFEEWCEIIEIP